jgi:polar amino acid transport system substrate-binding protein
MVPGMDKPRSSLSVGLALLAGLVGLAGLAGSGFGSPALAAPVPAAATTPGALGGSCSNSAIQPDLYHKGFLTVATDSPAYTPWFSGNKPSNGKGYESAVAYAVAGQLGFGTGQVHWTIEPFNSSYAPGPKKFDFDINEISYTPQRAQAVSFSASYYDVTQSLIALKGSAIVTKHTPAELRSYVYGDQIGTTSLAYIETELKPKHRPLVFDTLNDVKSALQAHRISAFVADTPDAQYMAASEFPGTVLVGQLPGTGHYGLLFRKGDPLVGCVNRALGALRSNGTLASLQHKYLSIYTSVPALQP